MKRKAKKTKKNKIDPNFVPKPAVKIGQGVSFETDPKNNQARGIKNVNISKILKNGSKD
jgi:hypothetical protein